MRVSGFYIQNSYIQASFYAHFQDVSKKCAAFEPVLQVEVGQPIRDLALVMMHG